MHVAEPVEPRPLEYALGDLIDRLRRDGILPGVEVDAVDIDELCPGLRCAGLWGSRLLNFGHGRISYVGWGGRRVGHQDREGREAARRRRRWRAPRRH